MQDVEVRFATEVGNSHDDQARFAPGHLAPEGRNSHHAHVCFTPEGANSRDDQVQFAWGHLGPEGANSHNEQVCFAREGRKQVELFGKLDLCLVVWLQDPTGQGHWGVVTDLSG